jgi:hypothetical protein
LDHTVFIPFHLTANRSSFQNIFVLLVSGQWAESETHLSEANFLSVPIIILPILFILNASCYILTPCRAEILHSALMCFHANFHLTLYSMNFNLYKVHEMSACKGGYIHLSISSHISETTDQIHMKLGFGCLQ